MPLRRKITRKKRVRVARRTTKRSTPSNSSTRPYTKVIRQIGVPDRVFVKLNYILAASPISVAGVLQQSGNLQTSLNDPDFFLGGHQPMWYDQYGALYSKYRVYGIRYHVTVFAKNNNVIFYTAVRHQNSPVSDTNLITLMERSDARYKLGNTLNNGKSRHDYTGYIAVSKTLGVSKEDVRTDDKFSATWTTNPVDMAYLCIYTQSMTEGAQLELIVRATYLAELYNRVSPIQS